ncbi:hypothetical protein HDU85_007249 [Gaertneriomyces sp. JEL0708]|nr:hypothetical protein HDU85_007249 [Gaertneriomyces sp. JEL0708]
MSDTVEYDASVKELSKHTKHQNIFFIDDVSNNSIKAIIEEQKTLFKENKSTLLLFIDDAADGARSKDLAAELGRLYTKSRHFGISIIVAIQSVKGQLTSKHKNCTTEWVIFRNAQQDMKVLSETLASAFKTSKEVLEYLTECTKERFSFCYIDTTKNNAKEMYRYCDSEGFKDYFDE